ncbi:MAG: RNA-dependent RNA polymerase [Sanya narnavirus 1]|nr:MAG: RNA-dependent RNA polymerase [Sanya narnavirus 1]UHR49901.1 MAG: RNA-dependent RNA polymerase [Sanya narnavirus 1]UHR49907.1 MAG: RNA-dependent RNA polymerase [Sanya narnavirus 1]UHR49918.1 MAG: RNA-dependent RNA polymerase [Sanya narnavirus 1]
MLPVGDAVAMRKALKGHRAVVTRPPPTPSEQVADEIYAFAKEYMMNREEHLKEKVSFHPTEGTASRDYTIERGGRVQELLDNAWAMMRRPGYIDYQKYPDKSHVDEFIVEAAIDADKEMPFYRVSVLAVAEPGNKARVLCKFPAVSLVPGDIIRRQLWPIVASDPDLDFDQDPRSEKFLAMIRRTLDREGTIVSSDLSNATDYIPHMYAQALWAGLLESFEAPRWVRDHIIKMFSPMEMTYPDGKVVWSKRGIQMGTPLSFMTLSLLHKFAVRASGHEFSAHIIRGDDLLGVFTSPVDYFGAMASIGFKINRDKTIVSRVGGVFAEQTVRVKYVPRRQPHKITFADYFGPPREDVDSVAVLNDVPMKGALHVDTKGSVLRGLGRWYGQWSDQYPAKCAKIAHRVIRRVHRPLLGDAKRWRVPLHLPLELGGAGIPDRKGRLGVEGLSFDMRRKLGYACSHFDRGYARAVRRLDGGSTDPFEEHFEKELRSAPLGQSVYEYDPYATEYYAARRRKYYMAKVNRPARKDLNPPPLHSWVLQFNCCPSVQPRWAVSKKADVKLLVSRLKMFSGCYVPHTIPATSILARRRIR